MSSTTKPAAISNHIFSVNLDDFEEKVIQASFKKPILVDYWADWCPPCITIAPVIEKVIIDYNGAIKLAKLEVDEGDNMKLAGKYQIRGFPTIMLFENGVEVDRFSGAKSYSFIDEFIQQHSTLLE